jgi:hypothetical protein
LRWQACQLVRVGIYKAPRLALALGLPRMALSVGCGLLWVVITGLALFSRLDAIK